MQNRANNLVIGVVTSLEDPDGLGRVKVRYPHLADNESDWAKLVTPMAGANRGLFMRPEVGDEVMVALEFGDYRRPYVIGSVWNRPDPPPQDDGKPKENNWRFIRSRSGHIVKLDDTQGAEKIEIVDKTGTNSIVFDSVGNTITITASQTVKIEAPSVQVTGTTDVKVEAPKVEVSGQTQVSVSAPTIELKAQGQMTVDGGASLILKGGVVMIN